VRNPSILVIDRSDDLMHQIQRVGERLRPRPDVVACSALSSFDDVVDAEGPFDLLVAGPSMANRSCLGRLSLVHSAHPGLAIVLAFTERPDAKLREIVRTGAVDLLHLPVEDHFLLETVERAIDMSRASQAAAPAEPTAGEGPAGTVITVTSASGGSGKTFLASNIAYFLHEQTGKRTCIVDLDLQFGEIPTALRLRPRYTIVDLLQRDDAADADLGAYVEEYLVEHSTGIFVLAAPKDPSDADRVHPPDVLRVMQALRSRFDYVVADTPAALSEVVLATLDLSDHIYLVATLDTPSLHSLGVYLATVEKLKISQDVRLVLNKEDREVGIDVAQVVKVFDRDFDLVLPYGPEVSRSLNLGTPLLAYAPASPVSRGLCAGLSAVVAGAAGDARARVEAPAAIRVARRRLFGRARPAEQR
jgi:pilus assembly protein CpaE